MLFAFDEEQLAFRDAVRDVLRRQLTPAHLRAAWEDGHDHRSEIWPALAALGLTGLVVPAAAGGAGGSAADLALPLEECGYHCLPEPVVETVAVVPAVIARFGGGPQGSRWLGRLVEGSARAAAALGGSALVPHGAAADVVLVRRGAELHLAPQDRVTARRVPTMDPTRRMAECSFDLDQDTLLTDDPLAAPWAVDLAVAATASVLVGISQRLLDDTRDHLLQREQFGVRIGTFQALKHRLADVAVATEAARSLSWSAAQHLADRAPDASVAASMAKGAAGSAAHLANAAALQLHGGIGFTWEHDLHLWLQRGQALETAFGTTADHRAHVADAALAAAHPAAATPTPTT